MAVTELGQVGRVRKDGRFDIPADTLRDLGWAPGDAVHVARDGDALVLTRRPVDWVTRFAGKMDHVWGTREEVLRYLDEERESADRSLRTTADGEP